MRAATYARKSTTAEKHEDGKSVSVATQRDNARRYVERHGGILVAEFEDDARSGADFTRPGLAALLAVAERREFDTLVVADRSRIGRDQIETPRVIHRLTDCGITILSYESSIGVIAKPNAKPIELFMGQVSDYASAEFRANIKVRARAGLVRAVEQGHHTGGPPPYGYRIERSTVTNARGDELPGPSKLVIDEEQARIIRGLFKMCADGHGLTKSAKTLNGETRYAALNAQYFGGTSPPCPGYLISPTKYMKPNNWCPTAIRAMLDNPIYAGKQRWGAMQNYERGGRVHLRRKQTDPERVLLLDVPHLRIVPAELETRVRKRRKASAEHYAARKPGGEFLFGAPETGVHSQFLLSGLLRCSVCGGSMIVTSYTRKGRKQSRYLCTRRNKSGEQSCTNTRRVPLHELDAMVLAELRTLLTPERIEQVVVAAAKKARERRRERPEEADRIRAEIAELRRQYDNFMNAIGAGKAPAGVTRLMTLEAQIATKERLLEELGTADVVNLGDARLMRVLRENLGRFTECLSSKSVPVARQALRRLLGGAAIQFTPVDGGGYELAAETRLGPLFEGVQRDIGAGGGT